MKLKKCSIKQDINKLKEQPKKAINQTKKLTNEYKKFALRGNIVDLAVGVALGSAFNLIVNSIVTNFVTPLIGLVTHNVDISSLFFTLNGEKYASLEEAKSAGAMIINYGASLNAILNFFFVSIVLFFFLKYATRVKTKLENDENENTILTTKQCPYCYSTIDINATKCAFCTSDIQLEKYDNTTTKNETEII